MTNRGLDKVFRLRGKWLRHSRENSDAGIICRCIYEHLREYYIKSNIEGTDDSQYIGVVSLVEDIIAPSKLLSFITLGLDDEVKKGSCLGDFIHSVLAKHKVRRPDIYAWLDDMDLSDMGKSSFLQVSGIKDEIFIKEDEHE